MRTKLLLIVMAVAVLVGGCPSGFSVGVLTTKLPGTMISEPAQLYGLTFALHWNFENTDNGIER